MSILPPHIWEYRINHKLRKMYEHMIDRCTNKNYIKYKSYEGAGIKVCERWLKSKEAFIQDAKLLPNFEEYRRYPGLYQLDKDFKQLNVPKEQRVYSPETCMFLYCYDNINIRAYEYNKDNRDTMSSIYYGVSKIDEDQYLAQISHSGILRNLGVFSNEMAAASCYNYWHRRYEQYKDFSLLNTINEMPPSEFTKYKYNLTPLYHVVSDCKSIEEVLSMWNINNREVD